MAEEKKNQEVVTIEELEKSWNDSKAALRALLGIEEVQKSTPDETVKEEKSAEVVLEKAEDKKEPPKKEDEKKDEPKEDEDEEDEETEDEPKKDVKKSLEDSVSEDSEAEAAMDVEPFLRQLVKSLDEKFTAISTAIETIAVEAKGNSTTQKTLAKALSDLGDQQMLIANTVEAIGGQPVPSRSILRKSKERFEEVKPSVVSGTREQILDKALKLSAAGKLEPIWVTKIENRLNKGIALPDEIVKILQEDK